MSNADLFNELIGSKITRISRACNCIMFTFETNDGRKIHLHVQCFLRLLDKEDVVLTTENLYHPGKKYKKRLFKQFDWSMPGNNVYDDLIEDIKTDLLFASVKEVFRKGNDLFIVFDQRFRIDILEIEVKSLKDEYSENYRIFDDNKDKEHFVV